jgi:glycosyltransferase involved in cell wall biosynthesis
MREPMKKNVLILIDHLERAGAETVAVRIAAGLARSSRYSPLLCATRSGGPLEEILKESAVEYFVLGRSRPLDIGKFAPLARTIRKRKIALIHAHKMGSNVWGNVIGRIAGGPAVIAHVHGQKHSARERAAQRLITVLSDKVIAVSEYERASLVGKRAGISTKFGTVHNGIHLSAGPSAPRARVKDALGLPADGRLVGIVAGLRPEKSVETFLAAAREVSKTAPDARFLVVGGGTEMEPLIARAAALGIAERCRFTGFRSDAFEIASILDVAVLSSKREGLPMALLEYMALSKPIVATRVGGVPEAVEDGVNGYLVAPGDHQAMAERIGRLLRDAGLAAAMGAAGRRLCAEKFGMESMLARIETIYDEVLAT